MIRNILHIGMGVGVVFLGLVALVELLGYVTWYLMPRDAESMQQASEFEAIMGRLVQSPTEGAIQVVVPDRHPKTAKAVHRVMEWPERRGRQFREAPMLQKRVAMGELPPVGERLPENPLVIVPPHQNGPYGGTWTRFATGPRDIGIVEARFAYEGLVRWDPMGQKILPNLATHWEIAPMGDGRTHSGCERGCAGQMDNPLQLRTFSSGMKMCCVTRS